jgi:hypothetical protein
MHVVHLHSFLVSDNFERIENAGGWHDRERCSQFLGSLGSFPRSCAATLLGTLGPAFSRFGAITEPELIQMCVDEQVELTAGQEGQPLVQQAS